MGEGGAAGAPKERHVENGTVLTRSVPGFLTCCNSCSACATRGCKYSARPAAAAGVLSGSLPSCGFAETFVNEAQAPSSDQAPALPAHIFIVIEIVLKIENGFSYHRECHPESTTWQSTSVR